MGASQTLMILALQMTPGELKLLITYNFTTILSALCNATESPCLSISGDYNSKRVNVL